MPLFFATLAVMAALTMTLAHADEPQGAAFGMHPEQHGEVHVRFTLEPGETQSAGVRITNTGDAPGSALSFVADAQTLVGGGFAVALVDEPRHGPTQWVDFPDETTPLDPDAFHFRTVTVHVPDGTLPGDYLIGMIVQGVADDSDATPSTAGVALDILNRQALAIMVDVPGPRTPSLAIGAASLHESATNSTISIALTNDGNEHLTPSGEVSVVMEDGTVLADIDLDFGRFYTGTGSAINLPVEGFLPVGTYVITTEMWDDETDMHTDVVVQNLVVGSRELPAGEVVTALNDAQPLINVPPSLQDTADANAGSANTSMPMTQMLLISGGVGVAAVATGVVLMLLLQRRRPAATR